MSNIEKINKWLIFKQTGFDMFHDMKKLSDQSQIQQKARIQH